MALLGKIHATETFGGWQCDQIWQNFATLAQTEMSLAIV